MFVKTMVCEVGLPGSYPLPPCNPSEPLFLIYDIKEGI